MKDSKVLFAYSWFLISLWNPYHQKDQVRILWRMAVWVFPTVLAFCSWPLHPLGILIFGCSLKYTNVRPEIYLSKWTWHLTLGLAMLEGFFLGQLYASSSQFVESLKRNKHSTKAHAHRRTDTHRNPLGCISTFYNSISVF